MKFGTKTVSLLRLFAAALSNKEEDYTSGSIRRAIFLLSVPMILEMSMESIFAVVDVFFVSRLGTNAVAAVGLTESVLTIVYSLAWGMSMGTTALVARRIGEKKPKDAAVTGMQAIYLALGFALVIGLGGGLFADRILALMGSGSAMISQGASYTRWMLGGNITIMLLFLVNAIFRGAGDASLAMRSLVIANLCNMTLDPILIFGLGPIPAMGVAGAAIATNIGRGIGVGYQLYHLLKGRGVIKITRTCLPVKWKVIGRIVNISAGGAGQFIIGSASWIFLMRIMAFFGSAALAGYTIAIRVIVFALMPSWGMANAAATLVGQNLGAQKPERAEESVWKTARYNMIFLGSVSVIFLIAAERVVRLFSSDLDVVTHAVTCLRIVCLGYAVFAYGMVICQAFNGAGDTRTPTLLNVLGFWMIQIPLAYALAVTFDYGPTGVFIAVTLAESILALVSVMVFRRGYWKKVKV